MRLAPGVATSVALMSLLTSSAWQFAYAGDTSPLPGIQPAAGKHNSPSDNSTKAPLPGTFVNGPQPDISILQTSPTGHLDLYIGALENRVRVCNAEGRLTNEEVETFQAAIEHVAEIEAECLALQGGKLGQFTELALNLQLDRLARSLATSLHDRTAASLDLSSRKRFAEVYIQEGEADGRLTKEDADNLRQQLSAVQADEKVRTAAGKLSYSDAIVLSVRLDQIIDRLGHMVGTRKFVAPEKARLADEANRLLKNTSKQTLDAASKTSENLSHSFPKLDQLSNLPSLNPEEAVKYAADLEWLSSLLEQAGKNTPVATDPEQLLTQVNHKIAQNLLRGHLTPSEAHEADAELDAIDSELHSKKNKDGTLNPDDKSRLALEIERVAGHMAHKQHAPSRMWAGLPAYQAALATRINDGLKAGRLTDSQAQELKTESQKLIQKEKDSLEKGTLDADSAVDLTMQALRLNIRLHHTLKDREITLPDIDQLQSLLDKTIAGGVENGSLTYNSKLLDKLNHISELKRAYSESPGGLDNRAHLAIASEIEQALMELHGQMRHEVHPAVSIDARLNQLTKNISNAAANGVLSIERATQYKAAIDTIYGDLLQARKAPEGLSANQSLAAVNDVLLLTDQLTDEMRESATLPYQLAPRYQQLALEIGNELSAGRITMAQADGLIESLDRGATRLVKAASSQGGLSHGEGLRLEFDLESLTDKLICLLQDQPVQVLDLASRGQALDTRLADGLATGKLTVTETQRLRHELDNIMADAASLQHMDNKLSYLEALAISNELDQLTDKLNTSLRGSNKSLDVTTRRTILEKELKENRSVGKLQPKDADALALDLDRLAQSEAAFRSSDEGLSYDEALILSLDLDRISARMEKFRQTSVPKHK